MTGNRCFLDTSVIIHYLKKNESIVDQVHSFDTLYVSDIAVGELYYGAYASSDPTRHIKQVELFLNSCIIVPIDTDAAIIYGQIKADLKRKGKPIPENDIWIAATSLANKLPLFTTDNHFKLLDLELI